MYTLLLSLLKFSVGDGNSTKRKYCKDNHKTKIRLIFNFRYSRYFVSPETLAALGDRLYGIGKEYGILINVLKMKMLICRRTRPEDTLKGRNLGVYHY